MGKSSFCCGVLLLCITFGLLSGCGSDGSGSKDTGTVLPDSSVGDGALDQVSGDSKPQDKRGEDGQACQAGEMKCVGEREVGSCQNGAWVVATICETTHFCYSGTCVKAEQCEPGTINGCLSALAQAVCNAEGTAYVPQNCPGEFVCLNGQCSNTGCLPGQERCVDDSHREVCGEDGSWGDPVACEDGLSCVGGKCMSACLNDPKWNNSSVGCEYWTVDLDQSDKATLMTDHTPPAEAPHSVVLSNPGTAPAKVSFSTIAAGITLPFAAEEVIPPGETREFVMPRMDLEGAGIFDRSVRIRSNRPIVATQFNPKDVANTYSNDSSLLIPAEMLGDEYFILGWPSQMEMSIGVYPALLGYFTVVATQPGTTEITVTLASESFGLIPNSAPLAAGVPHTFNLEQFEVIQFEGVSKTMDLENDMSGSHVVASQRVAVFVGHEGPLICPDEAIHLCAGREGPGCCCLEHLEEQLLPLDRWSNEYIMGKTRPRGYEDWDVYRVQAGFSGVTVTTDPPIPGLDGVTFQKQGDFVQVVSDQSFKVSANGPIQVAQYLSSMTCTTAATGDPSQVMGIGINQYRDNYQLLVPQGYDHDYVTIVRPIGSTNTIDGANVEEDFEPIGDTGYEVGYLEVDAGPHMIDGTQPFGLVQYGFFEATSYANPAGMNLSKSSM